MPDARIAALARNVLDYALDLRPGEKFLIEGHAGCEPLAEELIKEAYKRGGIPFFDIQEPRLRRALLLRADRAQLDLEGSWRLNRAREMDAFLRIEAGQNLFEFSDVPGEVLSAWSLASKPALDEKLRKKWCVLRLPTPAGAQAAGMSSEAFEDFVFRVSTLDYSRMDRAMQPLVALMNATDRVDIRGPGTDLSFSIKGIPALKSCGRYNIPDGEAFTAPVRDSVNGRISFNAPSAYDGTIYENVSFLFEAGKITEATGNFPERINHILDTDEGARYVGEFALGVNPYVDRAIKDTLFDEKIAGSFHFTPGEAYEVADNGNRSAVHWDLVLIQTPEWGGGEIWFDGVLVRKDGRFVLPELDGLNPENLI